MNMITSARIWAREMLLLTFVTAATAQAGFAFLKWTQMLKVAALIKFFEGARP